MALIDQPDKAMRLARAIASDISLYNEERIKDGIENDNLFEAIQSELDEGRELFKSRVDPGLLEGEQFFELAIVDIIIRSKGHLKSKMW